MLSSTEKYRIASELTKHLGEAPTCFVDGRLKSVKELLSVWEHGGEAEVTKVCSLEESDDDISLESKLSSVVII